MRIVAVWPEQIDERGTRDGSGFYREIAQDCECLAGRKLDRLIIAANHWGTKKRDAELVHCAMRKYAIRVSRRFNYASIHVMIVRTVVNYFLVKISSHKNV